MANLSYSPLVRVLTQPTLRDLYSYQDRTTKRLLRCVLLLASEARKSVDVQKEASSVEVWLACIAPVAHGYQESSAKEERKRKVLRAFHSGMLNIVFHDVFMPVSPEVSKPAVFDLYFDKHITELDKLIPKRIKEYRDAMNSYFERSKRSNNMPDTPTELAEALIHNLFYESDSPGKTSAEYAKSNQELFTKVMTRVAIPMIRAFRECLNG